MKVIGYLRVSTEEQSRSGLGLDAQRAAIEREGQRRDWDIAWIVDEGYSAKDLNRPGIIEALALLEDHGPKVLVVARLDRLSRSLFDFAGLMERAKSKGWALIALDLGVDMTTPEGEMMANVMASFAQYERRIISQRTQAAMQTAMARGKRMGRPRTLPTETVREIVERRESGQTLQSIADYLNEESIPTASQIDPEKRGFSRQGGLKWWPSTVAAVLRSVDRDREALEARKLHSA